MANILPDETSIEALKGYPLERYPLDGHPSWRNSLGTCNMWMLSVSGPGLEGTDRVGIGLPAPDFLDDLPWAIDCVLEWNPPDGERKKGVISRLNETSPQEFWDALHLPSRYSTGEGRVCGLALNEATLDNLTAKDQDRLVEAINGGQIKALVTRYTKERQSSEEGYAILLPDEASFEVLKGYHLIKYPSGRNSLGTCGMWLHSVSGHSLEDVDKVGIGCTPSDFLDDLPATIDCVKAWQFPPGERKKGDYGDSVDKIIQGNVSNFVFLKSTGEAALDVPDLGCGPGEIGGVPDVTGDQDAGEIGYEPEP